MTTLTTPNGTNIGVEIANNGLERTRGLSNRDSLPINRGMLFLFPTSDIYSFWMKDTKIPLDLLWIQDTTIVDITTLPAEIPGETIPQYQPKAEANRVLELNSGEAAKHGLKIGSHIIIDKTCLPPASI
ncbi:MAG TPA: DUF192 domain-containing protein [Patescibacteria group bacterium]